MVKVPVDEFQRENPNSKNLSQKGMCLDIGTVIKTRKQRLPDKECITGAFKSILCRQVNNFVSVTLKPSGKVRLFACPLLIAKPAGDKYIFVNETCISSKGHVRKAWSGSTAMYCCTQILLKSSTQGKPLFQGQRAVSLPAQVHPGVDLIVNAVIRWPAHEKRWLRHA